MDHSTLQAPDNEADEKWANPGMSCFPGVSNPGIECSKSRGRTHAKAEKRDSGIVSDISVSPSRHGGLTEKSLSEAASDEWENSDERSKKIKTRPMLQRTLSGLWAVDSSFQPSRAVSHVSSCLSMRSTISMRHPLQFRGTHQGSGERNRTLSSEPNALSVKSDKSTELGGNLHGEKTVNTRLEESTDSEQDSFNSMETFNDLKEDYCTSDDSSSSNHSDLEQALDCVHPEPSDVSILNEAKEKLKERYRNEQKCIFVKSEKHSSPILLNDVFIEPYITKEEEEEEESHEHEMREPKPASNQVTCNIFKQQPEKQKSIKTMLTKGIAKIGKTIYLQKFVLDWAEGKTNQEIDLILALCLQDLNLKKEEKVSLNELLQHFFPQVKQINLNTVRIMIIFDGLDEYRLPLDFQHNTNWTDPTQPATVDVLLTNLIKGNLLPSALLWITLRPGAAHSIPSEYIQKVTKIHGFKDAQKEEYFRKRIRDKTKANGIIEHIKISRAFHGLCHIPAYCSLLVSVLQDTADNTTPQTLKQKLTSFLQAGLQSKALTDLSST